MIRDRDRIVPFPKRDRDRDVTYGVSTGPHVARQKVQKIDPTFSFPFRCFPFGWPKPGTAEPLGARQASPFPTFLFPSKTLSRGKVPEETQVLNAEHMSPRAEIWVEADSRLLPGKVVRHTHAHTASSGGPGAEPAFPRARLHLSKTLTGFGESHS